MTLRFTYLILLLLLGNLYAQNSPNGPPGPEGNPNNGNNGNNGNKGGEGEGNEAIPPTTESGAPLPSDLMPDSPERRAGRLELLKLKLNIFNALGNIDPVLLVPAIRATANVAGLSSTQSEEAQGAAAAVDNNIEQRMTQIRDASFHSANVFLTDIEHESVEAMGRRKYGVWLVETGLFSRAGDTHTATGMITAGMDCFINKHAAIGLLGVYGYSDSRILGINGHLLGNSKIGGVYAGAWTGKPGVYLTLSSLLNATDFRLFQCSNSHLVDWTGFGSIGYETSGKSWTDGPVASVQYDNAAVSGYDLTSLHVHRNITNTLQSRVGWRVSYKKQCANGALKSQLQLMWEHHYTGSSAVDVNYIGIPDTQASIGEAAKNRDSIWGSASLSYHLRSGLSLYGAYAFDLAGNFSIQQVDLGFHVSF